MTTSQQSDRTISMLELSCLSQSVLRFSATVEQSGPPRTAVNVGSRKRNGAVGSGSWNCGTEERSALFVHYLVS